MTRRRVGRTLLKLRHVEARRLAIAKLGAREPRLQLPGHHLQRAAGENA